MHLTKMLADHTPINCTTQAAVYVVSARLTLRVMSIGNTALLASDCASSIAKLWGIHGQKNTRPTTSKAV